MRLSVIVERGADGWFVGSVQGLSGCHTQARTNVDLIVRVCEVVCLYWMWLMLMPFEELSEEELDALMVEAMSDRVPCF